MDKKRCSQASLKGLISKNPERAKKLFEKAQADAKAKYEKLVEMAK